MKHRGFLEKIAVDLVGGCLVVGCVSAFIWLIVGKSDLVRIEIQRLSRDVAVSSQGLYQLRAEHQKQKAILQDREALQSRTGKLPDRAPTEGYFQRLSVLSAQHGLKVLQHHPLPPVEYPGLLEERFTYEVSGNWPDIVGFLQAIESMDAWADVAYFKVSRGGSTGGRETTERPVALTISMFSALPWPTPDGESGA